MWPEVGDRIRVDFEGEWAYGTVTKVRSYSRGGPPVPKIPDRYINFPDSPDPRGPPPPPPLPAGWYAATDEATGKEYFYTAQGDVQWDRPLK